MKTMTTREISDTKKFVDTAKNEPVIVTDEGGKPTLVTLSIDQAHDYLSFMRVESDGIEAGLEDVEAGRYEAFTSESADAMLQTFAAEYQHKQS